MRMYALLIVVVVALSATACARKGTTAPSPPVTEPAPATERPGLSAAECEAQGGKIVGDIGDGAVHRPDYQCPDSGAAPIGTVVSDPDGPVAIEGAVCCK
jgi:hypothetical protein